MGKYKAIVVIFNLFLILAPAHAEISDYFNSFYLNYLEMRKVAEGRHNTLDLIYEISKTKVNAIEKYLNETECREDALYAIALINNEYRDLYNNLDFEVNYIENCPLKKKQIKKLKKMHKKFMLSIQEKYL